MNIDGMKIYYKYYLNQEIDIVAIDCSDKGVTSGKLKKFTEALDGVNWFNLYSTDVNFSAFLETIGFSVVKSRNRCVCKWFGCNPKDQRYLFQMLDSDVF